MEKTNLLEMSPFEMEVAKEEDVKYYCPTADEDRRIPLLAWTEVQTQGLAPALAIAISARATPQCQTISFDSLWSRSRHLQEGGMRGYAENKRQLTLAVGAYFTTSPGDTFLAGYLKRIRQEIGVQVKHIPQIAPMGRRALVG